MDRRCFGCASKFSVFKKELGCKSCGHSFCAGCLGFSTVLPQYGSTKQKICKRCYESITSGGLPKSNVGKWSPPENYKKRVAALEAKMSQSRDMQRGPRATNSSYQGLSPEDRAIAERLDRLRQETKPKAGSSTAEIESRLEALRKDTQRPVPSTQEMEHRLAVLQGRTPSSGQKQVHQPPDTRAPSQKVDDLLTQLNEEVAIDQKWDPDARPQDSTTYSMNYLSSVDGKDIWTELNPTQLEEEKNKLLGEAATELRDENTRGEKILDIAKRLAKLQGKDPEKVTLDQFKLPDSDEETEEDAIQRILVQLSEEVILDEASGFNIPPDQSRGAGGGVQIPAADERLLTRKVSTKSQPPAAVRATTTSREADSDDEELPWCCICNEDAVLRCHGCDDDLYCKRCFREGHDEFDRKEHRTSNYRPPPKKRGR
ncbi:abscission/NoCut checkpoint regulator [Rhinophrynus dorsalis]